jgi:indolepyruvate ferredoxin oxidoreductase
VTVEARPGTGLARPSTPPLDDAAVPEPAETVALVAPYHVYIPGVGGTGVLTVNALLSYAAVMDGRAVLSYDQTGAAQKWGPVLSSLVIAPDGAALAANKVGLGKADLYLAFDLLGAAAPVNLDRCDPDRTAVVLNSSILPTGEMIRNVYTTVSTDAVQATIGRYTRADRTVAVDARRVAEALFGDYMTTNLFAIGVAYQAGLLPLTGASIEAAIRLNDVAVDLNLQAFRYGRLYQHDPARVEALITPPPRGYAEERARAIARLPAPAARAYTGLLDLCADLDDEARRLLAIRVAELIEYQDAAYAQAYVQVVRWVAAREREAVPGRVALSHAVIRNLYKLMAYKDEYEVARLHLKPEPRAALRGQFSDPVRTTYHFHPPLLRALGLRRKLPLGSWFDPALKVLTELRHLRGTPLDVFGYAALRREERELIGWYQGLLETAMPRLRPSNHAVAVELAELPDAIRGYEQIKEANAAKARERASGLLDRLNGTPLPLPLELKDRRVVAG